MGLVIVATGTEIFRGGIRIITGGIGTAGGIMILFALILTIGPTIADASLSLPRVCSDITLGRFFALLPTFLIPSSVMNPGLLNDTGLLRVKYDFLKGVEADPFGFSLFLSLLALAFPSTVDT